MPEKPVKWHFLLEKRILLMYNEGAVGGYPFSRKKIIRSIIYFSKGYQRYGHKDVIRRKK